MTSLQQHNHNIKRCFHCGEDCVPSIIKFQDKDFCCNGCKMVFSILSDNKLNIYYKLNDYAGTSFKNKKDEKFAFLDEEGVSEKLLDYLDKDLAKVRFTLPQIHCSSCLYLLENLYKLNEAILNTQVNFLKKEVQISFDPAKANLRQIVELLSSIGYSPSLNFEDIEKKRKPKTSKTLYYQLGLAGFAFGNIMLMSFPEYLGLSNSNDDSFSRVFGFLNLLLAIPVVVYSGKDYWISAWQGLRQNHLNIDVPICLGMLALFGRSTFEILTNTGAGYLDSLSGFIFFLLIGKWFQQKTYDSLSFERDYKSYFPISTTLKKGIKEKSIVINKLKVGDTIIVKYGELIPADAILTKGSALIDYSFVTGESKLIRKEIGDKIFAGGKHMNSAIELEIEKEAEQSYLTQLWNDESFSKNPSENLSSRFTDKLAKSFTLVIILIAVVTYLYWLPKDIGLAINAMTAVLIVACPCALALSAPFIFGNAMRILGRAGIYLKNALVIERLSNIDHIVFDKTGTITTAHSKSVSYEGDRLNKEFRQLIKSLSYHSSHPVSKKIHNNFKNENLLAVTHFKETIGQGISGIVNNKKVRLGSSNFINKPENLKGVIIEIDDDPKGSFSFTDAYREGLHDTISHLKENHEISMITGDNDEDKKRLASIFGHSSILFKKSPLQKLSYIKSLQNKDKRVMMIGDGLNDAGALQQSNIGLALTEKTANFTPASDIISLAAGFNKIPALLSFSKKSIWLLYIAYAISFAYNIIGLSFAVQASLSPVVAAILMPLSSITTVVFGIVATNFVAKMMNLIK